MEQEAINNPKVFISYSWSNEEYQHWVVDLAKRLVHDGIEIIIDVWDLSVGQDKYAFMEQMVESEGIDKVLILCDEKYKQRADEREGGVGDETQIISSSVYSNVNQEKFIPIVATRDESGNAFVPNYITSRIYIDLSDNNNFEENYESLLRNIYKVPLHQKPQLGKAPSYLFEKEVDHFKTTVLLKRMDSLKDKNPEILKGISIDFMEEMLKVLDEFIIDEDTDKAIDDVIVDKIKGMQPLQNDFVSAMKILCETEVIDSDYIIEFFERLYGFSEFRGDGTHYDTQMDHYKFFIQQSFIYTIALLLRYKKYNIITELVNADYIVDSRYSRGRLYTFNNFRFPLMSLDNRNRRLKLNRISLHGDLMIETVTEYKKDFLEADILLYYIGKMQKGLMFSWFPSSYIYFKDSNFRFISRMSSKRHFEEVKGIFNVSDREEFIEKASKIEYDRGFFEHFYSIPSIDGFIELDRIATKP